MNIALVNPEYNTKSGIGHGGIATYTYNIANALSKKGHSIFLFLREGIIPDYLNKEIKVIEYHRSPLPIVKRLLFRILRIDSWEEEYSYGLYNAINALNTDIKLDIVDIPEYNGLAAAFGTNHPFNLVINFRTPRIIVNQYNGVKINAIDRKIYKLEARAVRSANYYRTSSNALRDRISQIYKIDKDQITVIRNPMSIKSPNKNDSQKIKILFVGRLEYRKGLDLLSKSISDILKLSNKVELHFAGEISSEIKKSLLEKASIQGKERVIFYGALNKNDLQEVYNKCNIFIFPSLFDNSPNALLEAMSSNLAILASDAPGVNEIIRDNVNGLLFKTDDKESFLSNLNKLIKDEDLRLTLAQKAIDSIKENYAPEKIADETLRFYDMILQENK